LSSNISAQLPEVYKQAIIRWKLGHHTFHVLLVSMNTVLEACLPAVSAGNWMMLVQGLVTLRTLFDSATSTMLYTADFSEQIYEDLIRPSMAFPLLSPGFSGQLNTEHQIMQDGVRRLSEALKETLGQKREQWPPAVAKAWTELGLARARNRKFHALVCRKFVPGGDSLLRQFYRSKDEL
jgi:hypothetical protein